MRTLRLCSCLIVLGALFILGGCKEKALTSHDVNITSCVPNQDPIEVHEGDQVHWEPADPHDYTVSFSDPNEPTSNPFKVKHGSSNPNHPIHGHKGCSHGDHGDFYCKYSLTRDSESTPCADPGVHIVP